MFKALVTLRHVISFIMLQKGPKWLPVWYYYRYYRYCRLLAKMLYCIAVGACVPVPPRTQEEEEEANKMNSDMRSVPGPKKFKACTSTHLNNLCIFYVNIHYPQITLNITVMHGNY